MHDRHILPLAALRLVPVDASLSGRKLWVLLEELLESKLPVTDLATVTVIVTPTEDVPVNIALTQIRAHAVEVIVPKGKLASLRR